MSYDFIPSGKGEQPIHEDVTYEFEQFPEDKTEKDLERHVAPAVRGHMKDFLSCIESRKTPVADIEQGYISTTACILANLSMQLGRSITWDHAKGDGRERRGSQQAAAASVSRAVRPSRSGEGVMVPTHRATTVVALTACGGPRHRLRVSERPGMAAAAPADVRTNRRCCRRPSR